MTLGLTGSRSERPLASKEKAMGLPERVEIRRASPWASLHSGVLLFAAAGACWSDIWLEIVFRRKSNDLRMDKCGAISAPAFRSKA